MSNENKITNWLKSNLRWIIVATCTIILMVIIINILNNKIQSFDMKVYSFISNFISQNNTIIMKVITEVASATILCGMCATILIFIKNKKYGLLIAINLFISTVLNIILKNIFDRARPEGYRLIEAGGFSFPSGHSMASMTFYGFLIYLILKKVQNKYIKWTSVIILSIIILAVGISRIYLGVHYASDVIGGFCFSIIYLAFFTHFVCRFGDVS
ncbi:MAG: phosphatase PAP2 family protein [Clostridia bacterium]